MIDKIRTKLDDRGVSPVIGVILMVAITVILAAVIGSFVLGIGGDIQQAPQASLSMSDSGNGTYVNVTHQGGDTLDLTQINYSVDGGTSHQMDVQNTASKTELAPGQTIELKQVSTGQNTIRVIHVPSGQIIAESTVRITGP